MGEADVLKLRCTTIMHKLGSRVQPVRIPRPSSSRPLRCPLVRRRCSASAAHCSTEFKHSMQESSSRSSHNAAIASPSTATSATTRLGADLRALLTVCGSGSPTRNPRDGVRLQRHVTFVFFCDHLLPFTLGIGEKFPVADRGEPARAAAGDLSSGALGITGQPADGRRFDMSFFHDKPRRPVLFSPLSMLDAPDARRRLADAEHPLVVGVLQFPIPLGASLLHARKSLLRAHRKLPGSSELAISATVLPFASLRRRSGGVQQHALGLQFPSISSRMLPSGSPLTHAEYPITRTLPEGSELCMWARDS